MIKYAYSTNNCLLLPSHRHNVPKAQEASILLKSVPVLIPWNVSWVTVVPEIISLPWLMYISIYKLGMILLQRACLSVQ